MGIGVFIIISGSCLVFTVVSLGVSHTAHMATYMVIGLLPLDGFLCYMLALLNERDLWEALILI